MYREAAVAVRSLIQASDLPWLDPADLARSFCGIAQRATGSPWVRVELEFPGQDRPIEALSGARPSTGAWRAARPLAVPVRYQGTTSGSISILVLHDEERLTGLCAEVARQLAYQAKRLELGRLMRQRFGRELHMAGASAALGHLDRFLEQAARSSLPVLFQGEPGAEAESLGLALHLAGPGREHWFVQVHCAALTAERLPTQLAEYLRAAAAGTLLLSRVDELDPRCQRLLCQALDGGELDCANVGGPPVRLVATTSRPPAGPGALGTFYRPLLDRLDILHCALTPLRERREDVVPAFLHSLRKLATQATVALSEGAQSCLRQYDWPGDALELWQTAARVALTLEQGTVEIGHLELHAPQVVAVHRGRTAAAPPLGGSGPKVRVDGPAAPSPEPSHGAGSQHPCIERAMSYIYDHFDRKLPLAEVAGHAHASISHLAHLLRQETGMTFTQILTAVRIEHAKRLLRDSPWESITAIGGAAGFSELRHFERTFKSLVGLTPKSFRRAQSEDLAGPAHAYLIPLRGRAVAKRLGTLAPLSETPQ